jgi:hypothetical protein
MRIQNTVKKEEHIANFAGVHQTTEGWGWQGFFGRAMEREVTVVIRTLTSAFAVAAKE